MCLREGCRCILVPVTRPKVNSAFVRLHGCYVAATFTADIQPQSPGSSRCVSHDVQSEGNAPTVKHG